MWARRRAKSARKAPIDWAARADVGDEAARQVGGIISAGESERGKRDVSLLALLPGECTQHVRRDRLVGE